MRVFWTDRAKQRLRELHDYIALEAPLVTPQISSVCSAAHVNDRLHRGRAGEFRNTIAMTFAN